MDKWSELRHLIEATLSHNVQYSHDKAYDRYSYQRILIWMDILEAKEKEQLTKTNAFLYTDVPEFDKNAWIKILEEHGLQGLA